MIKELKQSRLCNKIISDMSFVNLNSIANIFNEMSISKYISWTYKRIKDKTFGVDQNITEIILCCSHKVKNLVKDVKKYYRGSVCTEIIEIVVSFINLSDYSQILEIWSKLCILLLSEKITLSVQNARKEIADLVCLDIARTLLESNTDADNDDNSGDRDVN